MLITLERKRDTKPEETSSKFASLTSQMMGMRMKVPSICVASMWQFAALWGFKMQFGIQFGDNKMLLSTLGNELVKESYQVCPGPEAALTRTTLWQGWIAGPRHY